MPLLLDEDRSGLSDDRQARSRALTMPCKLGETRHPHGVVHWFIGSHFRIVIPSDIAYGPRGSGGTIGPNATLVFEIELFEILD